MQGVDTVAEAVIYILNKFFNFKDIYSAIKKIKNFLEIGHRDKAKIKEFFN